MGGVCKASYMAWDEFDLDQKFPVKRRSLDAPQILGSDEQAAAHARTTEGRHRYAPAGVHSKWGTQCHSGQLGAVPAATGHRIGVTE